MPECLCLNCLHELHWWRCSLQQEQATRCCCLQIVKQFAAWTLMHSLMFIFKYLWFVRSVLAVLEPYPYTKVVSLLLSWYSLTNTPSCKLWKECFYWRSLSPYGKCKWKLGYGAFLISWFWLNLQLQFSFFQRLLILWVKDSALWIK